MTTSLSRLTHTNCSHDSLQLFAEQDDFLPTTIERCVTGLEAKATCLMIHKASAEEGSGFTYNPSCVGSRAEIFA